MDFANQNILKTDVSEGQAAKGGRRFSNPLKIPKFNFKFNFNNFNKKSVVKVVVPVVIAVVVIGIVLVATRSSSNKVAGVGTAVGSIPVESVEIKKEYKFPVIDETGKKAGEFSYTIENVEIRRQIVVKGQNAAAVPGRIFLIANLKLVNSLKQGLSINSRDFIRISVNGNDREWLAPDIHNDPVEVQAISTKYTRVAIAINEKDENVRLQVGEINGEKEVIPVKFD